MDTRLTRQEIVEALTKEGIYFPPTATVVQLRTIYGQVQEPRGASGSKDEPRQNTAAEALPISGNLAIEPPAVIKTAVKEPAVIRSDETPAAENLVSEANVVPESTESLEAELKVLHLRLEILRAQEEIRTIESGGNKLTMGQRSHIDLNEIDAVIPPFSGEDHYDIVKWFNQFEDYVEMCGYGEKQKCLGLRRRLSGAAKNYVFNLGPVCYLELKAHLVRLFKRTVTRQEVYRQLQARKLQSTETALSYLISMQTIAGQCGIDEQELIDFIIDGIPDTGSHVAFLYGAHTMDELIRRLDRFEQKRRHAAIAQKNTVMSMKTTSSNKTGPAVQPNTAEAPEDSIRCYNCSQFGHYQSKCPKPIRPKNSCFQCGVVGHYRQDCPKRVRAAATIAVDGAVDADPVDVFQTLSAKMASTSSSPPKRPKLDPILNCKRKKYLSWDDYFMANAVLASERSKDPTTQVGAVIVNENKRIVGTGYNGLPNKCSDDEFPWYKAKQVRDVDEWHKKQDPDFVKQTFVVHAEANAILNKNCADLKNTTLYTTLFPCNECAKLIIQAGIKKIYYLKDKLKGRYASTHSRLMFDAAEIVYTKFEPKINEIVIKLVD